jgi:hypothetical protein
VRETRKERHKVGWKGEEVVEMGLDGARGHWREQLDGEGKRDRQK